MEANFEIRKDIKKALIRALEKEKNKLAQKAIEIILKNSRYASREKVPLCQDTGLPVFFIKLGKGVFRNLEEIKKQLILGIKEATYKGFLRSSLILDPVRRERTSPNIPPVFHIEFSSSQNIEITLLVKGFGSENQTRLYLLSPNTSREEIVKIVVNRVKEAGSSACPPYIIGVGIGGTSDMALILSKKATLLDINKRSNNSYLAVLERKIEKKVNRLGIGPLGVGGRTTCLGVRMLTFPTHIAGLPLAISLGCHATRSAKKVIKF